MDKIRNYSLSEQVFARLEHDILIGKYQIGSVVTEMQLQEDMGVSRTPIREAVGRLEQEGLVRTGTRGIEIIGITSHDVSDIFEIRVAIEGLAVAKATKRITDVELHKLKETLDLQEYYVEKGDADHIRSQDSAFHEMIYEYCGSDVLCDMLSSLHRKVQQYRLASVSNAGHAKISVEEHKGILAAMEGKDAVLAKELMEKHVINAQNRILGEQ